VSAARAPSVAAHAGGTDWQQYSVLVVDDEEGMRSFITRALGSRCGLVEAADSVEAAQKLFARLHFDLIILDITLPGRSGLEWLNELREQGQQCDVILITAFADIETAIHALRAGASDFILKPFRVDQLMNAVGRCFDRAGLLRENYVLRREIARQTEGIEGMVGESAPVRELANMLRRVAGMPSTVLLTGESGVGKEVAARALHRMSARAAAPFVPVNCGAISAELIESELFGHVKGAFTGAQDNYPGLLFYAQGGTLFLDEISELPAAMQTKLLRVLEDRMIRPVGSTREVPVDIRVVAATNRDLAAEVRAGRFRQDLFYRLDVVRIAIPPLRERREDLKLLVAHFMTQLSSRFGVAPIPLDRETVTRMAAYDWPGNIRELRNLVERALILGYYPADSLTSLTPPQDMGVERVALDEIERKHILGVLAACGGNKSEAARQLGVSRKTIERKCTQWGITGI
jgi:DNA-binding NtrC family response regulator